MAGTDAAEMKYSAMEIYFNGYTITVDMSSGVLTACSYEVVGNSTTLWQISNPFIGATPFATNLCTAILLIQLLFLLFHRFPRFFSELITGLLMGPMMFGSNALFSEYTHPTKQSGATETLTNLGVIYYMFLVGLQMDLTTIRRISKGAWGNALLGILFPLLMGVGTYHLLPGKNPITNPLGAWFWSIALTVTSFPDLARILSDLKLLRTEVGTDGHILSFCQ
ncbi:hypothetical protein OIU78_005420 [Salix suchowensis]|nr:hypothetical protein OIU78_005420 [Salix suchowensis]